jgi:anion-transporting  ArsA/GET3 family ATPase
MNRAAIPGPSELLLTRSLVVCVGSGGVGKTTVAATMALWAAQQGRRVMVLTIDPARRLGNALGLEKFGNKETRIDLDGLGLQAKPGGELWAMMLDTRTAFDNLIRKMAPDTETSERILENPIYRVMSSTFAGTQEYMAGEMLFDLASSGRFDLVVLDTPPVKNALDFLEAPSRLTRFFDPGIIKWFLTPYDERRVFGRLVAGTSAVIFRLLGFVFGRDFLKGLSEFLQLFSEMVEGFRERHEEVINLLSSRDAAFVSVCAPTVPSLEVAEFFARELRSRRLPRGGTIVNQVHQCGQDALDPGDLLGETVAAFAQGLPAGTQARLLARLGAAHGRLREVASRERKLIDKLAAKLDAAGGFLVELPRLEGEVHDLEALVALGGHLFDKD